MITEWTTLGKRLRQTQLYLSSLERKVTDTTIPSWKQYHETLREGFCALLCVRHKLWFYFGLQVYQLVWDKKQKQKLKFSQTSNGQFPNLPFLVWKIVSLFQDFFSTFQISSPIVLICQVRCQHYFHPIFHSRYPRLMYGIKSKEKCYRFI